MAKDSDEIPAARSPNQHTRQKSKGAVRRRLAAILAASATLQDEERYRMCAFRCRPLQRGCLTAELALLDRPDLVFTHCLAAICAAHAGGIDEARQFLSRARQIAPDLSVSNSSSMLPLKRNQERDRWAEGLRMAGLPD